MVIKTEDICCAVNSASYVLVHRIPVCQIGWAHGGNALKMNPFLIVGHQLRARTITFLKSIGIRGRGHLKFT